MLARIATATDLAAAADAELAIEAASEDVELKLALFRRLDEALDAGRGARVEHVVDPDRPPGGRHAAGRRRSAACTS